jgi:uncharacterized membrane protein
VLLTVVGTVLCGVGLYTALFMLRKTIWAAQGRLTEPSVVQTTQARLYAGVPNAAIGVAYYPLLAIGLWIDGPVWVRLLVAAAALAAGVTSVILAYSLLAITRMSCPYCWTAHAVNWLLAALCLVRLTH